MYLDSRLDKNKLFKSGLRRPRTMKPCQIRNKPKHPNRGNTRNKMEGPTSKKTKEPPKRANHKGNIMFPYPHFK
jgi:hypothetical protein